MTDMRWPVEVTGADGGCIEVEPSRPLLGAFAEAGWQVVSGCRNGVCLACAAHLRQGRVLQAGQTLDARHDPGCEILPCRAQALGPLILHWPRAFAPGSAGAARSLYCRVLQAQDDQLHIELPPGRLPVFEPGQLLQADDGRQLRIVDSNSRHLSLQGDCSGLPRDHLRLLGPLGA